MGADLSEPRPEHQGRDLAGRDLAARFVVKTMGSVRKSALEAKIADGPHVLPEKKQSCMLGTHETAIIWHIPVHVSW